MKFLGLNYNSGFLPRICSALQLETRFYLDIPLQIRNQFVGQSENPDYILLLVLIFPEIFPKFNPCRGRVALVLNSDSPASRPPPADQSNQNQSVFQSAVLPSLATEQELVIYWRNWWGCGCEIAGNVKTVMYCAIVLL